jgi:hypothetical protein
MQVVDVVYLDLRCQSRPIAQHDCSTVRCWNNRSDLIQDTRW